MRTIARAATLAALVAVASAQQARDQVRITLAGTASVSGTIVLDDEKQPLLRRATVTLLRQGIEDIRTTATDDAGRYAFGDLPAGTYTLAASKGGHLAMSHGAPKPGMPGQAIVLRDGQSLTLSPLALPRGAVIAGRVLDRFGQPVPNLGVQASLFLTINGERRRRAITGGTGTAVTNQHGDYRMFGLQPGTYVVFATPPTGVRGVEMIDTTAEAVRLAQRPDGPPSPLPPALMYVPTLYPGVNDSSAAAVIELGKGQERTDVDFALQHVAVGQLRGTVTGPDGRPLQGLRVARQNVQGSALLPSETAAAGTDTNGRFTMANVAPGTYVVSAVGAPSTPRLVELGLALPPGPSTASEHLFGSATVTVSSGAPVEVTIRMEPTPVLAGTATVTGGAKGEGVTVRLVPVAGAGVARNVASATIDAEHRFRFQGVLPGSYRMAVAGLPRGVRAVSAMLGDLDVLDVSFDVHPGVTPPGIIVTLTDVPTTLSGRLIDGAGSPVSSLYVMAFSTNPAHWHAGARRIGAMRAGVDGSYLFDTLPPGEYFVCALTELDATLQYEPAFLQELMPASIRIRLAEGQTIRQDLRVGSSGH
jgi:protocatechuate 3,4-dioxygenase beta subunit